MEQASVFRIDNSQDSVRNLVKAYPGMTQIHPINSTSTGLCNCQSNTEDVLVFVDSLCQSKHQVLVADLHLGPGMGKSELFHPIFIIMFVFPHLPICHS